MTANSPIPAIVNAIHHATGRPDATTLPVTPEAILRGLDALAAARAGEGAA